MPSSTVTRCVRTGVLAGGPDTFPVRRSKQEAWSGHSTAQPSSQPSAREASWWVQVSSTARNSPSTLNTAMATSAWTVVASPGGNSAVVQTWIISSPSGRAGGCAERNYVLLAQQSDPCEGLSPWTTGDLSRLWLHEHRGRPSRGPRDRGPGPVGGPRVECPGDPGRPRGGRGHRDRGRA